MTKLNNISYSKWADSDFQITFEEEGGILNYTMQAETRQNVISHWILTGKRREETILNLQHPYRQAINEKLDVEKLKDENSLNENVDATTALGLHSNQNWGRNWSNTDKPQKVGATVIPSVNFSITGEWVG